MNSDDLLIEPGITAQLGHDMIQFLTPLHVTLPRAIAPPVSMPHNCSRVYSIPSKHCEIDESTVSWTLSIDNGDKDIGGGTNGAALFEKGMAAAE